MSSSEDHKSSFEDSKSWDTLRYSSDISEMSEEVDAGLEEVFERVENALKNQLNHLRSLGEAVNVIEREEMTTGTIIRRHPLPDSGAAKLSKREKLWKEGRRDLYRFIEDFEEQISARSFLHLRKTNARSRRGQSPELRAFPQGGDGGSVMSLTGFESPLQVSKSVERRPRRGQNPELRDFSQEGDGGSAMDLDNFDSPRQPSERIEKRPRRGQSPELRAFPQEDDGGSAMSQTNFESPYQVLKSIEKRPRRTKSPEPRAFSQEDDKVNPINFDSPYPVSKPTERYGKSGCFSPAPLSRARKLSPPPRPDPRPPTPPVPERHPSRRISQISSPTGSVMLLNTPANFVANMLPEEHVQMAKAKQRESMIRAVTHDMAVRRGSIRTQDSVPISPTSSYNATPMRNPHPSRSTSSLKLAAVAEEHSAPIGLIPLILTSSLRQTSRIPRLAPSVPYHAATLSASLASENFYGSPQEEKVIPPPTSHLPTAIRRSSGLFTSQPPEQEPVFSSHNLKPGKAEPDELKSKQIQFVREKLTRDRKKAELQWNEANRMLQGLPAVEHDALPPGRSFKPRPQRAMSAGCEGFGFETGDESMRTRIKNLWKTGTKKGGLGLSLRR